MAGGLELEDLCGPFQPKRSSDVYSACLKGEVCALLLSGSACKQVAIKTPRAELSAAGAGSTGLPAESPPPAPLLRPAAQSLPSPVLVQVPKAFSSHTTSKEHVVCVGDMSGQVKVKDSATNSIKSIHPAQRRAIPL